ncbi:MAG: HAD-IIIA family hydrolase [Candidatus Omnitrophica bacterium]|nr:HAD-IIIA family hydrolase [Candidatus Omnitrophota bacterium]
MQVVFLDRDGVINKFPGNGLYVTRVRDFHFIPRALEALKALTDAGYDIFVVSNQAGVGKGVYSKEKLDQITEHMLKGVKEAGGRIREVLYCTCKSSDACNCRKPRIGNIIKALELLDKTIDDAPHAYFVGDTEGDVKAGKNAGCKTIFCLSGREDREYMKRWDVRPDFIVEDLYDAAELILKKDSHPSRHRRSRPPKSR